MNTTTHRSTALITGAAKRLGAAVAHHLATSGYDLVLHYHQSHAEAETLAEQLYAAYGTACTLRRADLAHPDTLTDFWEDLPPCDLLVLNAATYERDTLASMHHTQLQQQLTVNFTTPLLLAQGFMAQLPQQAEGNIIVFGDGTMGWSVAPAFFSYAVSKHAWVGGIDLLAAAIAPRARANLLALPPILPNASEDDALFARLAERAPLKRNGSTAELCTAIDFLLASPGVTGQVLSLANGLGLHTTRPSVS